MWFDNNVSLSIAALTLSLLAQTASARINVYPPAVSKRGDCTTQTVASGDSCGSLASKCGISANDFTKYNSDPKLCSGLAPGQRVCCSAGTLPDIRPKPESNGTCASHVVQNGDTCSSIAAANGLKPEDLATFNDKTTWGWSGCDHLGAQVKICLSKGDPPMPQSVDNAVCGPLKSGSKPPTAGHDLASLNPCPLNSCCTIWGQCGITPEFCTNKTGSTGNPGTAPTGQNGCISNCGTDVKKGGAPSSPISVGYYESWNFDRPCLNMRADSIDTTKYTHYHWGFAAVAPDFSVSINDTYKQWSRFTGLTNIKKIVSFGGWGFSTDPSTYDILRSAVDPKNADHFANSVIDFINKNGLDGVDFDWEYPGAPDIPGIPPGQPSDPANYLAFLKLLRGRLAKDKSISIAAPASYWYLKQFPITDMADLLDYIVYMTYDLHGQWDYGNKFGQDGCASGNCLRSHVNLTETGYALAMITKAGVQANKIAVGISSYGRSFGMKQPGCTGPMCPFGGPDSTATPGDCTGTAGYISNAEIELLADSGENNTKTWYDQGSDSNMMTYGDNQWVAYMDDTTRQSRTDFYKGLGFAGTVDWAVDLLEFLSDEGDPDDTFDDDEFLPDGGDLDACTGTFNSLDDLDAAAGSIPDSCRPVYTIQALSGTLNTAVASYKDMMANGYDKKFGTYSHAVADSAGKSVNDFVTAHGNDYFSCVIAETSICCSDCKGANGNGKADPCAYCFDGDCYKTVESLKSREAGYFEDTNGTSYNYNSLDLRDHPHPEQVRVSKFEKGPEPCPPDYSKRGYGPDNPYEQTVWWTLNGDKSDKFYADLLGDTGIPKDKIVFADNNRGNGCPPSAKSDDDCWNIGMDYGIPEPHGYTADDVSNPKDVVQKALDQSDNLVQQLKDAVTALQLGAYYGDELELVDSVSIPVLMIVNAVDDMSQVDEVADKIDDEKKKALILAFIGAILFFVPIAGEVLGSVAELADIASILAIVSAAGDVAMGVYQVVDDPGNPLLGIMSIVLAPLALGDLLKIGKAANIRRGMSEDDVVKLGGKIASRMGTVKKVVGTCRKAL